MKDDAFVRSAEASGFRSVSHSPWRVLGRQVTMSGALRKMPLGDGQLPVANVE